MNFNKRDFLYIIVIIFIMLINYYNTTKLNTMNDKFDKYEQTITALNDSIHVTVKNGIAEYSKLTPEIDLDQMVKSEYFKTLSINQQKYYNELSKVKGLLAASTASLEKQGELLASITENQNPGIVLDDSIEFKLGTVLSFNEKDTTKHLQWNSNITLDKQIDFKFDYTYKVDIATTYERQKDKSIIVKYKINDPELKVNNMFNYIIPTEQPKSKAGKWFKKNKKTLTTITMGAFFLTGGYIGYTLAQ